jgi:benzoyl-CoA reductase subunit C
LFAHELHLFKESLEELNGKKISDEYLRQSIGTYNENRSLMGQIYELGLRDRPTLKGSEVFGILLAGLVLPKDEHNKMLNRSLESAKSDSGSSDGKVRLMIAGNTFENIELLQVIEECGGEVVIDDLDIGTRRYRSAVDENSEPIKALAERYLRKIPCPCKHPASDRLEHMLELAAKYRVKGVILVTQKYCDTHLYDRPWIESKLKEEGLQVLSVDHSDTGWVGGKFKTMVEAFIEMME